MNGPIDLSIITISTNEGHWIRPLLESCLRHKHVCTTEFILVDNGCIDDTVAIATEVYPQARLVRQPSRRGFASNNNLAIASARGRHILLLNPDTQLHPGVLDGVVGYLDANPEVGVLGCRLNNPDGSVQMTCRRFPGIAAVVSRWGERYLPEWTRTWQDDYLMRDYDHLHPREVDWVLGAFLCVRREVLGAAGLLDIRYDPLYYEDVDLCARVWRAGWKVMYLPQYTITHHYHRESAASLLNRMTYFHMRNVLRFWWLHGRWVRERRRPANAGALGEHTGESTGGR